MAGLNSTDFLVILRFALVLLAVISVRTVLIQIGLSGRLIRALVGGRTKWPGPYTHFGSQGEVNQALAFGNRQPRLYPKYLWEMAIIVLTAIAFSWLAVYLASHHPTAPQMKSLVVMSGLGFLARFIAVRRIARIDASVEWSIGCAPITPRDTNEAETKVARAYVEARACNRRIWTQFVLVALSGVFIWAFVLNLDGPSLREAMTQPETGPLLSEHVEAVTAQNRAYFFHDAGGSVRAYEHPREYAGSTLATYRTVDDSRLVALLLKEGTTEEWKQRDGHPALLYEPFFTLGLPELQLSGQRVLVVLGEEQDLTDFAKGRGTMGYFFGIVYLGFSVRALFLVGSFRRLIRVTIAKKGRLE